MESESLIAPVPRPPQPMTPIRSSRVSWATAREECTIAAVNEAADVAAAASEALTVVNSRRVGFEGA
jgi:hypothetical protein